MQKQPAKCLLCNKYSDQWNIPINRETHLRSEHPFDAISTVGIKHLINTAFVGPNLIKFGK
jgi:hypothetical protein